MAAWSERTGGTINISVPKLKKSGNDRTTVTVKLAENLGLTFGGRSYALFDCFSDGLTYIVPSIQLYDEGYSFALNGYEARVFWNIREVEDTDGSYERIWKMYGNRGIRDIAKAVALLRLEPLFRCLDPLRRKETITIAEHLADGVITKEEERDLLLSIAECYATLPEVYQSLDEPAKGQIGVKPEEIEPKPMVKLIRTLCDLFKGRKGKAYPAWAGTDASVPLMIVSALMLYPFTRAMKPRAAMEEADRLLADAFLEDAFNAKGYNENARRVITHAAALLVSAGTMYQKNSDPVSLFAAIANDDGVMNLTQCNTYQGEIWYNKEEMQRAILVTALAFSLYPKARDFSADDFINTMLEKELNSGYKLTALLRKEDTED